MKTDQIPKELLIKRDVVECNFIFCLYKDPTLIDIYKQVTNGEDIITPDGKFYYGLALKLDKAGYKTFDHMSIYTYIEDKPVIKNGFETRGGYDTVKEVTERLDESNVDSYYDELVKSNMLIRLHEKGFPVVNNLDKFINASSQEIYDYFDYSLADTVVGKIEKLKAEDLSAGYDDYINEWDAGRGIGYRISSNIVNSMTAGIHKKNLTLHLAGIGEGKTTTSLIMYVLPAIEAGDNVLIICNEQTSDEFRRMLMSIVVFNKISPPKGMNRQKLIIGGFSDEQKAKLHEAAEWIAKQPGKITFVEVNDYDVQSIKKIVSKYSRLGYGLVLVDTLKPVDDSDARSWGMFSEAAKELFLISKKTNTAIVCTAQLATDSLNRKYLDLTSVGKARSISETSTLVMGFRPILPEEVSKIEPYSWVRNNDGIRVKQPMTLDPSKRYIEFFIMKNRFGNVRPQIIMEFNQDFCTLRDVGYYDQPFDNFKRGA